MEQKLPSKMIVVRSKILLHGMSVQALIFFSSLPISLLIDLLSKPTEISPTTHGKPLVIWGLSCVFGVLAYLQVSNQIKDYLVKYERLFLAGVVLLTIWGLIEALAVGLVFQGYFDFVGFILRNGLVVLIGAATLTKYILVARE